MRAVLPAPKSAWVVLAVALVFHVLTISLSTSHRDRTSVLRTALQDSLAFGERLTDRSLRGIGGIWTGYIALVDLRAENDRLRAENENLRMEWNVKKEQLAEAERLRALVGFDASSFGKTVVARVIGRDASNGRQTLTLDRGRSSGIRKDTSVVMPAGVVGRVVFVAEFSSIVQAITDADSAVAILAGKARQGGLLRGNGGRLLDLDSVDDDSLIEVGDVFVTSGLEQIYPKGLPVGTAVTVAPSDDDKIIKRVTIQTAVDFGRLEEVLCIVDREKP